MHAQYITPPHVAATYRGDVTATVRVRARSDARVHCVFVSHFIDARAITVGCARRVYRAKPTTAAVTCLDCLSRMRFRGGKDVTADFLGAVK